MKGYEPDYRKYQKEPDYRKYQKCMKYEKYESIEEFQLLKLHKGLNWRKYWRVWITASIEWLYKVTESILLA